MLLPLSSRPRRSLDDDEDPSPIPYDRASGGVKLVTMDQESVSAVGCSHLASHYGGDDRRIDVMSLCHRFFPRARLCSEVGRFMMAKDYHEWRRLNVAWVKLLVYMGGKHSKVSV